MNDSNTERYNEIANTAKAEQQVAVIVALAKSPRLDRTREERVRAWEALAATAEAHLQELKAVKPKRRAPATKAAKTSVPISYEAGKPAPIDNLSIKEAKQVTA